MAEYNPTTFAEFLECLDNDTTKTVNLPVNAEWDSSDFEPEGHTGSILLYGTINGNGTKIKNLVIGSVSSGGVFLVKGTVTDLHFTDGVWDAGQTGNVVRMQTNGDLVQLCTFSASVQGSGNITLFNFTGTGSWNKAYTYRCAANVEFAVATSVWVQGYNIEGKYNNIKISGSMVNSVSLCSVSSSNPNGKMEYSYILCDTPAVTNFAGGTFAWSFARCTGANVTDLRNVCSQDTSKITLLCDSDFPNASQVSQGLRLCTESQLHDAAYLQSIGFPIGV